MPPRLVKIISVAEPETAIFWARRDSSDHSFLQTKFHNFCKSMNIFRIRFNYLKSCIQTQKKVFGDKEF